MWSIRVAGDKSKMFGWNLYTEPNAESEFICILPTACKWQIPSWNIINMDFLYITNDNGSVYHEHVSAGYVTTTGLEFEMGEVIYQRLSDVEWNSHPRIIDLESGICRARVSKGDTDQQTLHWMQQELEKLGFPMESILHDNLLADMAEKGYTYVALEVGKPSCAAGWRPFRNAHITLAYAGPMEENDRRDLQGDLNGILWSWPKTPPKERPRILVDWRKLKMRTQEESWMEWTKEELVWESLDDLLRMAEQKLLDPPVFVPQEQLADYLIRVHRRERARHEAHAGRITKLEELATEANQEPTRVWMATPSYGLGSTSWSLQDLLAYLADRIYHYPKGYRRNAKGKLVPPFVTRKESWHCTKSSDWKLRLQQ